MKQLLLGVVALTLLTGCDGEAQTEAMMAESTVVEFSVPDMVCESCVAKVSEVLAQQTGVQDVHVDLETKLATVSTNPAVFDSEQALATLHDYQFDAAKLVTGAK